MNKVQSIVRCSVMGVALAGGLGAMQQAQAAGTGVCWQTDKSKDPHLFQANFTTDIVTPENNHKDYVIKEDQIKNTWSSYGGAYKLDCACTDNKMSASYISAIDPKTDEPSRIIKGWKYFIVPGTDNTLAIATQVYISGSVTGYVHTPFVGASNGWEKDSSGCKDKDYASGGSGKLRIMFLKPFVGTTTINQPILNIYIASKQYTKIEEVRTHPLVATVKLQGTITVHQSCEIKNNVLDIDFGDIMANSFNEKGSMPEGFEKIYKGTVTMECGNISDGVTVSMVLKGELSTEEKSLKTTNKDIGIKFIDGTTTPERIIIPSASDGSSMDNSLPVNMTGLGQLESQGKTSFLAYPISTTGKPPKVGEFNATATLNVQLEARD